MVIDSSAVVAIELREIGYELLLEKLEQAETRLIGAPTVLETAMVLSSRLKHDRLPQILEFLRRCRVHIVPFNDEHTHAAIAAHHRFGRGRSHPAQLNLGDCLSYAIASIAGMPLLFTGDDFTHTDLERA